MMVEEAQQQEAEARNWAITSSIAKMKQRDWRCWKRGMATNSQSPL